MTNQSEISTTHVRTPFWEWKKRPVMVWLARLHACNLASKTARLRSGQHDCVLVVWQARLHDCGLASKTQATKSIARYTRKLGASQHKACTTDAQRPDLAKRWAHLFDGPRA